MKKKRGFQLQNSSYRGINLIIEGSAIPSVKIVNQKYIEVQKSAFSICQCWCKEFAIVNAKCVHILLTIWKKLFEEKIEIKSNLVSL